MATPIFSPDAPPPVGPYSHAIKTAHAIYCSGQIHMNKEGRLIDGSITEKTALCIHNIKVVLEAADSSLDKVVKTTVFLSDMGHFEARSSISKPIPPNLVGLGIIRMRGVTQVTEANRGMQELNREYGRHFTHKPARSCIAIKALPRNADVEIEVIALPSRRPHPVL